MAGLVPAIHVFGVAKTWMPGTRPGMTARKYALVCHALAPHPRCSWLGPRAFPQRAARRARGQGADARRRRRDADFARGVSAAALRRRFRGKIRSVAQRAQAQADV